MMIIRCRFSFMLVMALSMAAFSASANDGSTPAAWSAEVKSDQCDNCHAVAVDLVSADKALPAAISRQRFVTSADRGDTLTLVVYQSIKSKSFGAVGGAASIGANPVLRI